MHLKDILFSVSPFNPGDRAACFIGKDNRNSAFFGKFLALQSIAQRGCTKQPITSRGYTKQPITSLLFRFTSVLFAILQLCYLFHRSAITSLSDNIGPFMSK